MELLLILLLILLLLIVIIINQSWESFRGALPGTFPGTFGEALFHNREPFRGLWGFVHNRGFANRVVAQF